MMMGRQPAVGGPFNPLTLPTLRAWYDSSDASTFSYSSATNVSQWSDKSGNALHLNVVSGTAPTRNRTLNGLDVVDFGGAGNISKDANAAINHATDGSWTVFAVAVLDSTAGTRSIVGGDINSGAPRISQYIRVDAGTSQSIGFRSGDNPFVDNGPAVAAGAARLFRSVNTSTAVEMFVDGVTSGGSTAAGGTQVYRAANFLALGADLQSIGFSQRLDGAIAEVICCASALGSSDITATESYLKSKWGTP